MSRKVLGTEQPRILWILVLLLAVVMLLGLISCNAGGDKPGKQNNELDEVLSSNDGEDQPEKQNNELEEVLSRNAGIEGLSYRVIIQYPMWADEMRVWMQGNRIKTETVVEGEKLILVIDTAQGELSSYDAADQTATRMTLGDGHVRMPESPLEYVRDLDSAEWVPGDVAILDGGHPCRKFTRDETHGETVLYLWEDWGLPLRVEKTTEGQTTVVEFKELEIGLLPEDTFDLPAGAQVMDFWEDESSN